MKPQIKKPYEPPMAPQPLPIKASWALLGGISPKRFMKEYWQKKPLLVRGAIPAFALSGQTLASPLSMADLVNLAGQKNVESRLIKSKPWSLGHGPFKKSEIPALNEKDWTLLVQGVNGHHPAAKTVMSWFRFIPEARLDDLMISIAGPNGGVGPHVDSYDVFLLQMAGRRRWRISDQKYLSLKDGLPLKILKNFEATDDWVLEPGDMLYLPPNIAHDGIALDAGCQTWSVGFRVPTYKELVNEILWRTTEALENDPEFCRLYTDPHQPATKDPALVPDELIKVIQNKLNGIHWSKSDVSCTLAAVLSEPKPQVVFTPPTPLLGFAEFKKALRTQGLELSPLSKALYDKDFLYLNGESMSDSEAEDWDFWCHLAQNHTLPAAMASRLASLLDHPDNPWFEAYQSGWLQLMNT